MQLFYNPDISETTKQIFFSREESKHIIKVLRKSTGDILKITNGKGWMFTAEIDIANIKKCTASIRSKEKQNKRSYHVHLAVAPTKMNNRYEWFLEKATEIGVDSITPIICEYSERKVIKIERFQKIIKSAMKQSLHFFLPILYEPISFQDFIKKNCKGQLYIAHCEDTNMQSLKNLLKTKQDVTILIGPEGDFSVKEIEMAIQNNFIPVTLGTTRLRTETAAIVACHTVALLNE